jgi:hypothetical protein
MQATTRPGVVQALVAGKARILQNLLSQDPFLQTHPQYLHFVQMGEEEAWLPPSGEFVAVFVEQRARATELPETEAIQERGR